MAEMALMPAMPPGSSADNDSLGDNYEEAFANSLRKPMPAKDPQVWDPPPGRRTSSTSSTTARTGARTAKGTPQSVRAVKVGVYSLFYYIFILSGLPEHVNNIKSAQIK